MGFNSNKPKLDASEAMLTAISRLLKERQNMPDGNASEEEIKDWVKSTLGTSWWEYIEEIYDDVVKILTQVETAIPNTLSEVKTDVLNVAGNVDQELQKYFYPDTFGKELKNAIEKGFSDAWNGEIEPELKKGFEQVINYVTAIGQVTSTFEYYLQRFKYAEHSIKDLATIVGKNAPSQKLFDNLRQLISAKDPEDAVKAMLDLSFMLIVDNSPLFMLADIVFNVIKSGAWSNAFPYAIKPGDLNAWINPDPKKNKISDEERDFRLEMVAAIDHYCHGKFGGGSGTSLLRAADDRLAIELIADISSVLFSTVFGYVLRKPTLPSLTLPKLEWAHPFNNARRADDGASKLSITLSRQVAYPLKAGLGLILRGFWDVSTLNNSLVEGVTSLTSNSVSSLLESFLYDFLWSVEIHESYLLPDSKTDANFVWGWSTLEPIYNDSKQDVQYLNYGVWVRNSVVSAEEGLLIKGLINVNTTVKELLQNLLKDYGAYMESIRDYSDNPVATSTVTDVLNNITLTKTKLTVESTYPGHFPSIPVLRAYCNGNCVVMKNTGQNSGIAQFECDFGELPVGTVIYVRSNYGGTAHFQTTSEVVPNERQK